MNASICFDRCYPLAHSSANPSQACHIRSYLCHHWHGRSVLAVAGRRGFSVGLWRGRRSARVEASGESQEAGPTSMSTDEAYNILGVKQGAGFEEIMASKNKLTRANEADRDKVVKIETAYDILFMQSMKSRLSGKVNVSQSVRFADVARRKPAKQAPAALHKLPVRAETLPTNTALSVSALFAALSIWALAQGLTDPAGRVTNDAPGFQIALALGASVYLLSEKKRVPRGRAVGITVAGLVLGVLVGAGLQSWLRVDIVPIGGLASPAVFVSEFGLLALWASTVFLA